MQQLGKNEPNGNYWHVYGLLLTSLYSVEKMTLIIMTSYEYRKKPVSLENIPMTLHHKDDITKNNKLSNTFNEQIKIKIEQSVSLGSIVQMRFM